MVDKRRRQGGEGGLHKERGLKERRMEAGYSITATKRKASAEVGEEEEVEAVRVLGPPTHSGLGNICSGVARD